MMLRVIDTLSVPFVAVLLAASEAFDLPDIAYVAVIMASGASLMGMMVGMAKRHQRKMDQLEAIAELRSKSQEQFKVFMETTKELRMEIHFLKGQINDSRDKFDA